MRVYHWQTNSYARHKASDAFIAKMIIIMDRLVETYQGRYGRIKLGNKAKTIELDNISDEDMVKYLKTIRTYMVEIVPLEFDEKEDTDLFNIRDELLETIDQTLYLFDFK